MRLDIDDGEHVCTLEQFLADNAEDPNVEDYRDALLALQPGESVTFGGGAVATSKVTRLQDGSDA
jgi:hypothetical protein